MLSTSSKSAPRKPERKVSSQQKNQNYENVFVGVYRGNFASPSVSVVDTSDVMDNESSTSDPFMEPDDSQGKMEPILDENRINYEEQCDKALESHTSVRYENNCDVIDNKRGSDVSDKKTSNGSLDISISVNSPV